MSSTLFDWEVPVAEVGFCLCGGPLPKRPPYRKPAAHCSYWCYLVEFGPDFYTLETIAPWLKSNRPGSKPVDVLPENV